MERALSIEVGAYRFAERLGEGGVGQVYRAHGPTGIVAVKILGPSADFDTAARARFGREVRALGELTHPNIVPLVDHGFDDELGPYLVMPLLGGSNLRRRLGGQALGPDVGLLLARHVVAALAALHAAGYVHRDLKPENVMLTEAGSLVLIDFGLAFRDGMTKHTDTGAAAGTVGYMAPEQIEGRGVSAAADVFALGVMLYEWITGRRPFARERASEEVSAALAGVYTPVAEVERRTAASTAELLARCLAREATARPTAAALLAEIDRELAWPTQPSSTSEVFAAQALSAFCQDADGFQRDLHVQRLPALLAAARTAQHEQRPFAALALCDRGLAYARTPDEAKPFRDFVHGLESVHTQPAQIAVAAPATTPAEGNSPSSVAAQLARTAAQPSVAPAPNKRFWNNGIAMIGATAIVITIVVWALWPKPKNDPWASSATTPNTPAQEQQKAQERQTAAAMVSTLATTFNKALDHIDRQDPTATQRTTLSADTPRVTPTTAKGWLALAADQSPAVAVTSARKALELQPQWTEAEDALCKYSAIAQQVGATEACEAAVANHPKTIEWLGFRGVAQVGDAKYAGAIRDLTDVIARDEDPRWRVARATAYEKRGNLTEAKADLKWACRRGLEAACERAK
ncbi:MAG TPA: serine/threonine-protein kinase [Kofleriaceae bacterium]|nr:serine/threonine-protein kinase [Kofleriaceae bacterium]